METIIPPKIEKKVTIHHILANSYLVFFSAIVIGLILVPFLPYRFSFPLLMPFGFFCLIFGTALILWAQGTTRDFPKLKREKGTLEVSDFMQGPYRYFRSPTHVGLGLLLLGVACVIQSDVLLVVFAVAFLISRYIFVYQEENLLEEKYGTVYKEYRRRIKF